MEISKIGRLSITEGGKCLLLVNNFKNNKIEEDVKNSLLATSLSLGNINDVPTAVQAQVKLVNSIVIRRTALYMCNNSILYVYLFNTNLLKLNAHVQFKNNQTSQFSWHQSSLVSSNDHKARCPQMGLGFCMCHQHDPKT